MIGMAHCQMVSAIAAGSMCDPYWIYTTCLLNFEGPNGSASFIDSSGIAVFDVFGSATISTVNPIVGTASGNFTSGGVIYNTISSHQLLPPGKPLTIELMFRPSRAIVAKFMFMDRVQGFYLSEYVRLYVSEVAGGVVVVYEDTSNPLSPVTVTSPVFSWAINQVYYIKVTADGASVNLYLNDILAASQAHPYYTNVRNGGGLFIGTSNNLTDQTYGTLDNFRITQAIRPSGLGIVPTESYPSVAC